MIDGLIRLMNSNDKITGPINLGNPQEISILELAQKIKFISKSTSILDFKDLPSDDPKKRRPDILRANEYLKWQPLVDLPDGLAGTIAFFKLQLF
jgi:UDP-glucuronate decarboxylase